MQQTTNNNGARPVFAGAISETAQAQDLDRPAPVGSKPAQDSWHVCPAASQEHKQTNGKPSRQRKPMHVMCDGFPRYADKEFITRTRTYSVELVEFYKEIDLWML